MAGLGKGLLGALTKPVGGAMDLVANTGRGLIQGAGLSSVPRHHSPRPPTAAVTTEYRFASKVSFWALFGHFWADAKHVLRTSGSVEESYHSRVGKFSVYTLCTSQNCVMRLSTKSAQWYGHTVDELY